MSALSEQIGVLPDATVGGRLDVRIGSPSGQTIGSFEVPQTPESTGFQTYTIDIAPTDAITALVFVFVKDGSSNLTDSVCAVDWIYFSNFEGRNSK